MGQGQRIVVAGGAGFLGAHLCAKLIALGHKVVCIDNFLTGNAKSIEPLLSHPRFSFMEHDICTPVQLSTEQIYNLACPASPKAYQLEPIITLKTNVLGAIHLLELAKRNRAKILQASTSEIYGDPSLHPQPESYWGNVNPIGVRACYDEGKRCAETLFFDYYRHHGVEIKIARIFNTYGPMMRQDDGRAVSNFIVQALKNEPIVIHGHGKQTRSFCYVDDLVDGLIRLMESPSDVTGPMNLGNPEEVSIYSLAKTICTLTGSKSPMHYALPQNDDPKQRQPDIALAQQLLEWHPKIGLNEGLQRTITYFSKELHLTNLDPKNQTAFQSKR